MPSQVFGSQEHSIAFDSPATSAGWTARYDPPILVHRCRRCPRRNGHKEARKVARVGIHRHRFRADLAPNLFVPSCAFSWRLECCAQVPKRQVAGRGMATKRRDESQKFWAASHRLSHEICVPSCAFLWRIEWLHCCRWCFAAYDVPYEIFSARDESDG